MPTLMQHGATWLGQKLQGSATSRIAGRSVTYKHKSMQSGAIIGWVAQKEYEVVGDDHFMVNVTYFDWTFFPDELIVSGEVIKPRAGDRITETLNGEDITYELMPIDKREAVEWLDTSGQLVTLHTKQVEKKPTPA